LLSAGLVAAGSASIVVSGFLPWLRLRRDYSGFRLARLLYAMGDDYPVLPPSWLGLVWYLIPLAAVISWIALFSPEVIHVRRIHGLLCAVLVPLLMTCVGVAVHYGAVVSGHIVAAAGVAGIVCGFVIRPRVLGEAAL
jgi:hypothetical protein